MRVYLFLLWAFLGEVMARIKEQLKYDSKQPGHGKVRDLNRAEARDRYSNFEMKRDIHQEFMYDRVQDIYSSFYAGIDPRRRNEMADGGMVQEDRNEVANLSRRFVNQEYPRAGYYSSPYIDDSVKE